MKILLVEDSATLRHALCNYIRSAGHEPVVAKSGEEALQIVERTPVDLIIMDVEMPGLNGFETTRLIREGLGDHWVPIIFVTGKSEDESLEQGIEAGGDDYLVKPVRPTILKAKIRAMERITRTRDQLASLNQDLKRLSQRDDLTQLYNRRTFREKAEEQWRQAARSKQPLSILLLDIDYFKPYNDTYGHPAGDECIKLVAKTLSKSLNRSGDVVARYGGEEFIALLPNTPELGAKHLAEQIRKAIERYRVPHKESPSGDYVTVSIGASVVNFTTGTTLEQQISLADKALYEAKDTGRNRVVVKVHNPHCTVLVVDDDQDSLEVISRNLKGHCSVVSTSNSEECVALADQLQPDVILLDVYLPGVNGYEMCKALRQQESTKRIPIVLTSIANKSDLREFVSLVDANDFLQKPFDNHRLIAKLNQFLV